MTTRKRPNFTLIVTRIVAILLCTLHVGNAESLRLLLTTAQTTLNVGKNTVAFELYAYNPTQRAIRISPLDLPAIYISRSRLGDQTYAAQVDLDLHTVDHPPRDRALAPKAVESKRIETEVEAQSGDLIRVTVKLRQPGDVESNAVLLICSPAPDDRAAPKANATVSPTPGASPRHF
jgi:hypothetical protein